MVRWNIRNAIFNPMTYKISARNGRVGFEFSFDLSFVELTDQPPNYLYDNSIRTTDTLSANRGRIALKKKGGHDEKGKKNFLFTNTQGISFFLQYHTEPLKANSNFMIKLIIVHLRSLITLIVLPSTTRERKPKFKFSAMSSSIYPADPYL